MIELFEFLKGYNDGYGYSAEEVVDAAKEEGLVKIAEYVGAFELNERRWGKNTLYVYDLDNKLVGIEVYVMHHEDGEDQFEAIYEVEPYEYTETRYRKKNIPQRKRRDDDGAWMCS